MFIKTNQLSKLSEFKSNTLSFYKQDDIRACSIIDIETTHSLPDLAEIVDISIIQFNYSVSEGRLLSIKNSYMSLNDVEASSFDDASKVHHITKDMLLGHEMDCGIISEIINSSDFVVAHNTYFTKYVLEMYDDLYQASSTALWFCSSEQIDWQSNGYLNKQQEVILLQEGYYYDNHKSYNDVIALGTLLNCVRDEETFLKKMMNDIKITYFLVQAYASPFESKDILNSNGFFWNVNSRVWEKRVPKHNLEETIQFLEVDVYNGKSKAEITRLRRKKRFILK